MTYHEESFEEALMSLEDSPELPTKVNWNGRDESRQNSDSRESSLFKGVPNNAEGRLFMALLKKYAPKIRWRKRGRGKRADLAESLSYWNTEKGVAHAKRHNLDLEKRRKWSRGDFDQDLPIDHASHFSLYPRNLDKVFYDSRTSWAESQKAKKREERWKADRKKIKLDSIERSEKPEFEKRWTKSVAEKLIGLEIVSVSYMSEKNAEAWGWYSRPIEITLSDGHSLLISTDDEGNNGGSVFTSYEDLPTIPTL